MNSHHTYSLDLSWSGNTKDPRNYNRSYALSSQGKEPIAGTSDPASRGDPGRWNPEEMLLASMASCHMLWYLYLCAKSGIIVTDYRDHPTGILNTEKGCFVEATLTPQVVITDPLRNEEAKALHEKAHEKCYIINSVNFTVKISPEIKQ